CDLVLRRACYPGWTACLDGARPARIVPADGGLQSIRLEGSGVTRVELCYRPTFLRPAGCVSIAAVAPAAGILLTSAVRRIAASQALSGHPDGPGPARGPV